MICHWNNPTDSVELNVGNFHLEIDLSLETIRTFGEKNYVCAFFLNSEILEMIRLFLWTIIHKPT